MPREAFDVLANCKRNFIEESTNANISGDINETENFMCVSSISTDGRYSSKLKTASWPISTISSV